MQAAIDSAKQKTKAGLEGGAIDVDLFAETAETLQGALDTVLVAGLREASPVVAAANTLITRLLAAVDLQKGKNSALEALRAAIATAREDRESPPLKAAYDVVVKSCTTGDVAKMDAAAVPLTVMPLLQFSLL